MERVWIMTSRFLLWLIGVAIPVFIAACYGMPYQYSKRGRVVDRQTQEGIPNIMVTCVRAGNDQFSIPSWDDGRFELSYDLPCDDVRLTDTDGVDNGGEYKQRVVSFCDTCGDIVVEMDKAVP